MRKAELKSAEAAAAKALGALAGANKAFALAELAMKHVMARKKPTAAPAPAAAAAVAFFLLFSKFYLNILKICSKFRLNFV